MNIVLLGPPGAGKGTQGQRLSRRLRVPIISSGDMFRIIARQDTSLGRQVKDYMTRGEYVPDDVTIEVVLNRLEQPDAADGFILDGFPRTLPQANALDRALADRGGIQLALYITAPTEVLVERIMGRVVCPECNAIYNLSSNPPRQSGICDECHSALERRADEEPETVRVRLEQYRSQTEPIAGYYRQRGVLAEVDGAAPMAVVEAEVDEALAARGAV